MPSEPNSVEIISKFVSCGFNFAVNIISLVKITGNLHLSVHVFIEIKILNFNEERDIFAAQKFCLKFLISSISFSEILLTLNL